MDITIDYIPTERQKLAHSLPNKYKLYGGAVGGGKSYWLCAEAIYHALQYPGNRIMMCRHHLSNFRNSTLVTLLKLLPSQLIKRHNTQLGEIELLNGSMILYMGLGSPEEKQKLGSMELAVICIDEASEVDLESFLMACNRIERWVLPSGKRPEYFMLLASNPADNWLKEYFINDQKEDFVFIKSLPTDNPHLSKNYIKDLIKIYPKEWVEKYLEGDWDCLTGDNKVIESEWVNAAIDREIVIANYPIISCDPAAGMDESIVMYGDGNRCIHIDANRQPDTMITCGRFTRLYNKHNCKNSIIETDGLGIGFYDQIRHMGVRIQKFQSGSGAVGDAGKKKFYNLKAQAWFHARQLFEDGLVSIPNDPLLIRQLKAITYDVRDAGGKLIIQKKKEYKSRTGHSPDRADALVMMLWLARHNKVINNEGFRKGKRVDTILNRGKNSYGW